MSKLIYIMNQEKIADDEKEKVQEKMEEIYNYLLGKLKNEYKTFNSIYQKLSSEETKEIFQKIRI